MPCADLMTVDLFNARMDAFVESISFSLNSYSATIDELRNEISAQAEKIDRIYKVLGGDNWFNGYTGDPILPIDFEARLKEERMGIYTLDENDNITESKISDVTSITQFITRVGAVIYSRLGLDNYPIKVPNNLADEIQLDETEEGTTESESNYSKIQTNCELDVWQTKQLDSLFGRFPIKIKIKDNDLIQTGDQELNIKLPNLAETVAELTGITLQNTAKVDALINISMRSLVEIATDKVQNTKSYFLLDAITEYLNFKNKQDKIAVPFAFDFSKFIEKDDEGITTINNKNLADFLHSSEVDVEIERYDDDQTLEEELKILIESARIIKAIHYNKVKGGTDEEVKTNIVEQLKSWKDLLFDEEETEGTSPDDPNPNRTPKERRQNDFDTYLENVEQGFIKEAQGTDIDATKPFGKPWDRRPRIREIGKQGDLS
jgi:hypothetical protein